MRGAIAGTSSTVTEGRTGDVCRVVEGRVGGGIGSKEGKVGADGIEVLGEGIVVAAGIVVAGAGMVVAEGIVVADGMVVAEGMADSKEGPMLGKEVEAALGRRVTAGWVSITGGRRRSGMPDDMEPREEPELAVLPPELNELPELKEPEPLPTERHSPSTAAGWNPELAEVDIVRDPKVGLLIGMVSKMSEDPVETDGNEVEPVEKVEEPVDEPTLRHSPSAGAGATVDPTEAEPVLKEDGVLKEDEEEMDGEENEEGEADAPPTERHCPSGTIGSGSTGTLVLKLVPADSNVVELPKELEPPRELEPPSELELLKLPPTLRHSPSGTRSGAAGTAWEPELWKVELEPPWTKSVDSIGPVVTEDVPVAWIGRHCPSGTAGAAGTRTTAGAGTETVSMTDALRAERISEIVACREVEGVTEEPTGNCGVGGTYGV